MSKSMRQFFVQYLLTYLLILILYFSVYLATTGVYKKEIQKDCLESIQQGCEQLRVEVQRLNFMSQSLSTDSGFHEICNKSMPYSSKDLYEIKKLQSGIHNTMQFYSVSSNLLMDAGVLFSNGICLTRDRCYVNVSSYYPDFFQYGFCSMIEWMDTVRDSRNNLLFLPVETCWSYDNQKCNIIQLSCMISKTNFGVNGYLFFHLNADEFISILIPDSVLETGAVRIFDKKNNVQLMSYGNWEQSASEIVNFDDSLNGLSFQVMISKALIAQKTALMRTIFLIAMVVYILLGLILSFFLSSRNARPLEALLKSISANGRHPKDETQSDYQYIEDSFQRIGIDLSRAEALIAEQASNIRISTMERLINGLIYTQDEWENVRSEFPGFPSRYCVLYTMVLSDDSEINAKRTLCQQHLHTCFGDNLIVHLTERQLLIAILPLNDSYPAPDSYRQPLCEFIETMQKWYSMSIMMAVSAAFDSITLLHEACRQTRHYLRFSTSIQERLLFHDYVKPLRADGQSLDFIDNQRFYMLIRSGESNLCRQQIQYVRDYINNSVIVDDSFLHLIFDTFKQIFFRQHNELRSIGMEPPCMPVYSQKKDVGQLFSEITEHADILCLMWSNWEKQNESAVEKAILNYIEQNVFDPDLCIQQVLSKFNISERTLQRYMHEVIQKSFFEYISDIRLERARVLVQQTSMPIKTIAEKCGFSLANTFYKAYARRWGVSPGNERKGKTDSAPVEEQEDGNKQNA